MKSLKNLKNKRELTRSELKSLKGGLIEPSERCAYTVFYCGWKSNNDDGSCNKIGQCC